MKYIFSFIFTLFLFAFSSQHSLASFKDLPFAHENSEAILYLQKNGILSGYSDGTFKPQNTINRAEFVKIIIHSLLKSVPNEKSSKCFSDVEDSQWFSPYVCYAKDQQIISGYSDGTFKPEQNISFVEASKIIVNAFQFKVLTDEIWYKPYVIELSNHRAIPPSIPSFDHQITRGEMSEMMYRLVAKISSKVSLSYSDFIDDESDIGLVNATNQSVSQNGELSVREKKLTNGLKYFHQFNSRPSKTVYLELVVKSGSAHEEEAHYGVAHFLEHMAFNGTESYSSGDIFKYMSSIGAPLGIDTNATTGSDRTVYKLKVPNTPSDLENGIKILSEFAGKIRFDSKEIERERSVILEEMRTGLGKNQRFLEKYLSAIFQKSTYRHLPIGTESSLYSIGRDSLLKYYKKWYRPDNMAVLIVGDVSEDLVDSMVQQHFSYLVAPSDPIDTTQLIEPVQEDTRFLLFTDPESTSGYLNITFRSKLPLNKNSDDQKELLALNYAIKVLNTRFGDMYSAQEKEEVYMNVNLESDLNSRYQLLQFNASFIPSNTPQFIPFFIRELERFRQHGITDAELKIAKETYQRGLDSSLLEKDALLSTTHIRKVSDAFWRDDVILSTTQRVELLTSLKDRINLQYVNNLIRQIFDNPNKIVVLDLPQTRLERVSEKYLRDLMYNISNEDISPYQNSLGFGTHVAVSGSGKIAEQTSLHSDLGMTRTVFENGLILRTKKTNFEPDTVYIYLKVNGGDTFLPKHQIWLDNYLVESMLEGGTKNRSLREFKNYLNQKQLSLSFHSLPEEFNFSGYSMLQNFEDLLSASREFLFEPSFDDTALSKARETLLQRRLSLLWDPDSLFGLRYLQILMNDPARVILPTSEQIRDYAKVHLVELHKNYFVPSNIEMSVVGNIDEKKMIDLVSQYFGTLPEADKPVLNALRAFHFPKDSPIEELRIGTEPNATTLMVFKGIDDLHVDYLLWDIISNVLSERLSDQIRENLGATYSIEAYLNPFTYLQGGTLEIKFDSAPNKTHDLFIEVYKVLHDLKYQGITDAEMKRAIEPMKTSFNERLQKNSFWLYLGDEFNDVPYTLFHDRNKSLKNITLNDVNQVANSLDINNYFRLVLLPDDYVLLK